MATLVFVKDPITLKSVQTEEKITVIFDICSSSSIVEDLMFQGKLSVFATLLNMMKKYLREQSELIGFDVYKFIGDGWILLFPYTIDGTTLLGFLNGLSKYFQKLYNTLIKNQLEEKPLIVGLTFGVANGKLIKLVMLGKKEYIGRSINIASRLQSSIKDRDKNPQYKVLMSRTVAKKLNINNDPPNIRPVPRKLRNIFGGKEMQFVKVVLPLIRK